MFQLIVATLIVLSGSAFCAGAETALLSVSKIRVRQLAQSNKPAAKALLSIRENMNRPIATIVILNNIFNIVGSIVIGSIVTKYLGEKWLGILTSILTFLIIIFGEIVPKTMGERYADRLALVVAIPVKSLTFLLKPLSWLIEKATLPFLRGQKQPTTNEAEIQFLAKIGRQEGIIEADEAEMIQRVFQLNDLAAIDLMTPRTMTTYLYGNRTLADSKDDIIASQHTRIPVVKDSIDQILGIALKDELLTAIVEGKNDQTVDRFTRNVRFVPETVRADKLLATFQESREHLAIVLDEYGGVSGVVTLEDVLEVLTGEIVDETDRATDLQEIARRKRKRILREP